MHSPLMELPPPADKTVRKQESNLKAHWALSFSVSFLSHSLFNDNHLHSLSWTHAQIQKHKHTHTHTHTTHTNTHALLSVSLHLFISNACKTSTMCIGKWRRTRLDGAFTRVRPRSITRNANEASNGDSSANLVSQVIPGSAISGYRRTACERSAETSCVPAPAARLGPRRRAASQCRTFPRANS
jgi:hypothetical protein